MGCVLFIHQVVLWALEGQELGALLIYVSQFCCSAQPWENK